VGVEQRTRKLVEMEHSANLLHNDLIAMAEFPVVFHVSSKRVKNDDVIFPLFGWREHSKRAAHSRFWEFEPPRRSVHSDVCVVRKQEDSARGG